jgi:hypothetical protein
LCIVYLHRFVYRRARWFSATIHKAAVTLSSLAALAKRVRDAMAPPF